jgi:hypothetical protein
VQEFPQVVVDYKQFSCGKPIKRTPEVVDAVEEIMENLSQQVNLSTETCRTILKKDLHLYPHRITSVPELLAGDLAQILPSSKHAGCSIPFITKHQKLLLSFSEVMYNFEIF